MSWLPGSCPPSSTTPAPDTQLVCFVRGYSRLWLGDQEPGERCVLTNLLLVESTYYLCSNYESINTPCKVDVKLGYLSTKVLISKRRP